MISSRLVPFALVLGLAGCGSKAAAPDAAAPHDANFADCAGADAARPYMAGLVESSKSGAYQATLVSSTTMTVGDPVDGVAIGLATFTVSIADMTGAAAAGVTMTAEKPYMPLHHHGSSTLPTVTDQGDGTFVISSIDFFMKGYFEVTLDLQPPADDAGTAPAADKVVIPACVPG